MEKKHDDGRGGARPGAGRKPALTDFETWEAGNLCDLIEQRKLKAWALRSAYGKKRLSEIAAAQQALREYPIEFRADGDELEDLIDDVRAAFEVVGPISDDVLTAAEYRPEKILPRGIGLKRIGRRPKGIAARERVIETVARYLRRKWRRDISASAVRRAWKASRRLWRALSDEDDKTREPEA